MFTYFILIFLFSISLQASDHCNFKIQSIQKFFNDSSSIHKKLDKCIQNVVDQKSENYFMNIFSNNDGDFIYYRKHQYGVIAFSEKYFKSQDSSFYYIRHSNRDDRVIFSTRNFSSNKVDYIYYRKYKGDERVLWSVKNLSKDNSKFTYFRKYKDDRKAYFSIKVTTSNDDKIVYFRSQRGGNNEICSIKNGRFRDRYRKEITIGEFHRIFNSNFWNPLKTYTLGPSVSFLNSELARYINIQ